MRGPVLAGELGRDLRAILPGLGGGEDTHRPRGEGTTASGGRASTWVANGHGCCCFVRGWGGVDFATRVKGATVVAAAAVEVLDEDLLEWI